MTKPSRLAFLAGVLALAVAGCQTPDATLPVEAGPNLSAKGSAGSSYLVVANGNRLPRNLARRVAAAGGAITMTIPEIGIAVATSNSNTFAADASRTAGVRGVAPDLTIQWIDPDAGQYGIAIEQFDNPPFTGDDDFFFDLQWGHDAVDAPEAWDAGARGAGVRVAILDTGIDSDHPDIAPNLNLALSTSFVEDEDNINPPAGFDDFHHGTHTAGTVGAADNGFGTIGIAPEAELVAVKVLSHTGLGDFSEIIAGIVYAALIDADVINMSLGAQLSHRGEVIDDNCEVVELVPAWAVNLFAVAVGRATSFAYQSGTTVIAAAGNCAFDGDKDKDVFMTPADAPHVISIAATAPEGWAVDPTTDLDLPASYTNFGQSVISFAAPGGDYDLPGDADCTVAGITEPCWVFDMVFSTSNNGWAWAAGTSMAAPHASGVAALIIGENGGDMHPAQVEAALRKAADDLGKPGNDDLGAGRVNAANAVN
ncbi:MAG: S8 family serine peptidase [Planctomycetota bacterium]